jgi:hypothetical protein
VRKDDMRKTAKKRLSKATQKKAVKDLEVKPAKGGGVHGGCGTGMTKLV